MMTGQGTLQTGDKIAVVEGRTLAIILEVIEMQGEIEETQEGQIEIHWAGRTVRTSIRKFRERKSCKLEER